MRKKGRRAKTGDNIMKTIIQVKEWMTSPIKSVEPSSAVSEAYSLMLAQGIRRLAVVHMGKLVGIVTLGDLREARPSPATSLSIYELNYLLSKLTVAQVMTHDPYTITPDTPIQQAARLMLDRKIGGLPVLGAAGHVLGIITESDIFRMLVDQWDYFTNQHVDTGRVASVVAAGIND